MADYTCFKCGRTGHMARDCDEQTYAAELGDGDRPPWCGECERETRHIHFRRDGYDAARRCPTCHPSGHLLPVQFKRCKACKAVIYEWDRKTECGDHPPIGKHLEAKEKAK